jgi:hypothetical protein
MNTVTERNKIGGAAKLSGFSLNRFHLLLCIDIRLRHRHLIERKNPYLKKKKILNWAGILKHFRNIITHRSYCYSNRRSLHN